MDLEWDIIQTLLTLMKKLKISSMETSGAPSMGPSTKSIEDPSNEPNEEQSYNPREDPSEETSVKPNDKPIQNPSAEPNKYEAK